MSSEWKMYLVSKDCTESGVPVIGGVNMSNGRSVGGDCAWVSEEKQRNFRQIMLFPSRHPVPDLGYPGAAERGPGIQQGMCLVERATGKKSRAR